MNQNVSPTITEQRINISHCLSGVITAVSGGDIPDGPELDRLECLAEVIEGYYRRLIFRMLYLDAVNAGRELPEPDERTPTGRRGTRIEQAVDSAAVLAADALDGKHDRAA